MGNRWACTEDLKNYFRIRDLLGGLTEEQKAILRANIGLGTSEGGQRTPTDTYYSDFIALLKTSQLVTGARYIITDFQTIYKAEGTTWGLSDSEHPSEVWSLLVTAISPNKIDPRVVILEHPEYTVEYDPTQETLTSGVKTKGKITYLKDKNNNSAYYDFKNIRFRRTYLVANKEITRDFFTFSFLSSNEVYDASETNMVHDNQISENCTDNVFVGETYYTLLEPDCYGNSFYSGAHDVTLKWESINNTFYEVVVDLTGTIAGKTIMPGQNVFSSTVTKYIHNVNEACVMTCFDPDTYAQQITLIPDVYSGQIMSV